jgi:hypothetical protein
VVIGASKREVVVRTIGAVSACLLLLASWAPSARADLQDHSSAELLYFGVLIAATATSLVGNTVDIAKGNGSKVWGWMGFVAGSLLIVEDNSDGNFQALTIVGATTAGMGLWSLILAYRDRPGEMDHSSLRLAPDLVYRGANDVEPRVVLTLEW